MEAVEAADAEMFSQDLEAGVDVDAPTIAFFTSRDERRAPRRSFERVPGSRATDEGGSVHIHDATPVMARVSLLANDRMGRYAVLRLVRTVVTREDSNGAGTRFLREVPDEDCANTAQLTKGRDWWRHSRSSPRRFLLASLVSMSELDEPGLLHVRRVRAWTRPATYRPSRSRVRLPSMTTSGSECRRQPACGRRVCRRLLSMLTIYDGGQSVDPELHWEEWRPMMVPSTTPSGCSEASFDAFDAPSLTTEQVV